MSTLTFRDRLPRYIFILSILGLIGWGFWVLTMDHFSAHRAAKAFGEAVKAKDYNAVNNMVDYRKLERALSLRHYPILEQRLLAYFPASRRKPVGFSWACETCMIALRPFAPKVAQLGLSVHEIPSARDMSQAIIKKIVSPQTLMVLLLSQDQLASSIKALGDLYIDLDHEGNAFADTEYFRTALNGLLRKHTKKMLSTNVSLDDVRENIHTKQRAKQDAYDALPDVSGMEVQFHRVDSTTARIRLAKGPLGSRQVDIIFTRPGMFKDWKIVDIKEV